VEGNVAERSVVDRYRSHTKIQHMSNVTQIVPLRDGVRRTLATNIDKGFFHGLIASPSQVTPIASRRLCLFGLLIGGSRGNLRAMDFNRCRES
jgi:hypothetical protein